MLWGLKLNKLSREEEEVTLPGLLPNHQEWQQTNSPHEHTPTPANTCTCAFLHVPDRPPPHFTPTPHMLAPKQAAGDTARPFSYVKIPLATHTNTVAPSQRRHQFVPQPSLPLHRVAA